MVQQELIMGLQASNDGTIFDTCLGSVIKALKRLLAKIN